MHRADDGLFHEVVLTTSSVPGAVPNEARAHAIATVGRVRHAHVSHCALTTQLHLRHCEHIEVQPHGNNS